MRFVSTLLQLNSIFGNDQEAALKDQNRILKKKILDQLCTFDFLSPESTKQNKTTTTIFVSIPLVRIIFLVY